jgi:hypothetical protein
MGQLPGFAMNQYSYIPSKVISLDLRGSNLRAGEKNPELSRISAQLT